MVGEVKRKYNWGLSGEARDAEACLYVISYGLDRAKIGVADDARKRLRELQVGSPVELKLALTRSRTCGSHLNLSRVPLRAMLSLWRSMASSGP